MISKSKIKLVHSLEKKKFRDESQLFVAEGNKLVADLMYTFECEWMVAKTSWIATQGNLPVKEIELAEDDDIRKISLLKNPQDVLAVFKQPIYKPEDINPAGQLVLALDGIQDPGNVGTIIRLADWFGIEHILCNFDTADAFSPKTVQATMGALARVKVHYTILSEYLAACQAPIFGTFLEGGANIYGEKLSDSGIIVLGNEGKGIRQEVEQYIDRRLYIPNYPSDRKASESLNVATAAAIICAEFRRRDIQTD
ncbi:MAG: RNA methyltransferase [Tannerella sp.]|jgi:TrmH family RNA methyltransferase|nr:RNA methyltransferase [Tannerella sp.]